MKKIVTFITEKLKITSNTKTYEDEVAVIKSELNDKFDVRFTKTGGFEIIDNNKIDNLKPGDRKYVINGDHTAVRYQKRYEYIHGTNGWATPQLIKHGLHDLDECIETLKNYLIKRKEL